MLAAALLLLAAGCGGDGSPSTGSTAPGVTAPDVPPPVPVPADARPAGQGFLEYGLEEVDLVVAACDDTRRPANENAELVFSVDATGTASDGRALRVEVRRVDSTAKAEVETDTITIIDVANGTGVVARRFSTADVVTDIRDPDARRPLLTIEPPSVTGAGLFGPASAKAGDPALLGGAITLTCPA